MLQGGVAAAAQVAWPQRTIASAAPAPAAMAPAALADALRQGAAQVIDLRPAMTYRAGHIAQARWSIRPLIAQAVADVSKTVALVADEPGIAALAALDLAEHGCRDIRLLDGGPRGLARCWPAPSSPRPTTRPMPTASTSCSSPTAATRATRKPRASTSPGKPASSPSSTPRSAAPSASEDPPGCAPSRAHVARRTPREIGAWRT